MATSYFPAGCFGKLPHLGDFVRHNASSREMLAFDHWLQQGLTQAKVLLREQWETAYRNAASQHFLFYSQSSDRLLVGIVSPSNDRIERKYPFWVSLQVEKNRLDNRYLPLLPVIFSGFFQQANDLISEARHGLQLREIAARTENLNVAVAGDWEYQAGYHRDYVTTTTLDAFFSRLFGSFDDARKYLLFKNLTEILLPFRESDLSRLSLGLRFPLFAENRSVNHFVSFWLQVCLRLLGNPSTIPVMFWRTPAPGKGAHLLLFFRPPAPRNFVQLVLPEMESDIICELDEEGRDKIAEAEQTLSAQHRELLLSAPLSLAEFLRRL